MNRLTVFITGLTMGAAAAAFGAQLASPVEAAVPQMASAPQCVQLEQSAPDIRALVALMPAYVRDGTGADTPPKPRAKPDQIADLIGGLK